MTNAYMAGFIDALASAGSHRCKMEKAAQSIAFGGGQVPYVDTRGWTGDDWRNYGTLVATGAVAAPAVWAAASGAPIAAAAHGASRLLPYVGRAAAHGASRIIPYAGRAALALVPKRPSHLIGAMRAGLPKFVRDPRNVLSLLHYGGITDRAVRAGSMVDWNAVGSAADSAENAYHDTAVTRAGGSSGAGSAVAARAGDTVQDAGSMAGAAVAGVGEVAKNEVDRHGGKIDELAQTRGRLVQEQLRKADSVIGGGRESVHSAVSNATQYAQQQIDRATASQDARIRAAGQAADSAGRVASGYAEGGVREAAAAFGRELAAKAGALPSLAQQIGNSTARRAFYLSHVVPVAKDISGAASNWYDSRVNKHLNPVISAVRTGVKSIPWVGDYFWR